MSKVTFPLTGHSYSDDGSSDHDMLNGGHAENLLPMIGETIDTVQAGIDAAKLALQYKQSTSDSALSANQDAGDAKTARQDAQQAATQAKNWAATVNVPVLTGKAGMALFANPDESGMVWRRAVRSGGGALQQDNQLYIGWDGSRVRVQVDTTDLGSIVLASDCVGDVIYSASPQSRPRAVKCNGAALSRTVYAALYARIGTMFGAGDGATTFNVPDLRGEFIRVWDDGRGVDAGRAFGSWQDSLFGYHAHGASSDVQGGHAHGGATGAGGTHNHSHDGYSRLLRPPYDGSLTGGDNNGSGSEQAVGANDSADIAAAPDHAHGIPVDGYHAHNITIAGAGGGETRPRNVALGAWIIY
ncbi:phage tail protein [Paraburkholderia madseniana]|uniref:phage tail protein n=1 Tax=Paraburkholderia madseniana TaxID=2599607 RepID=UPI00155884D5|nr:phage tail protein [Paraburkholderia madseniana]NPT63594.1 hypothetical protein [Paraburkholderia madseniana]